MTKLEENVSGYTTRINIENHHRQYRIYVYKIKSS